MNALHRHTCSVYRAVDNFQNLGVLFNYFGGAWRVVLHRISAFSGNFGGAIVPPSTPLSTPLV